MTLVKICGLTREADVRRAAGLGAWACGFVLTASERQVTPARARELGAHAGRALTVAVFTTETAEEVAAGAAAAGAACIQLSAGADGPSVTEVRAAAAKLGAATHIIAAADAVDADSADLVILDCREPGRYGGTGRTADWAAAAAYRHAGTRLVLAGGLRPSNVDTAVKLVRPLAVDASSSVERSPGVKDPGLLLAFFGAVAGADAGAPRNSGRKPVLRAADAAPAAKDGPP